MAKRVKVLLVDDVDDSEAAETVTFALDGITYEIDLNDSHAADLRAEVQAWTRHARRTGGRKSAGRAPSLSTSSQERSNIRAWARDHGHDVGQKGRIASAIREAYAAAHN